MHVEVIRSYNQRVALIGRKKGKKEGGWMEGKREGGRREETIGCAGDITC